MAKKQGDKSPAELEAIKQQEQQQQEQIRRKRVKDITTALIAVGIPADNVTISVVLSVVDLVDQHGDKVTLSDLNKLKAVYNSVVNQQKASLDALKEKEQK